jgi:hypothetical protein
MWVRDDCGLAGSFVDDECFILGFYALLAMTKGGIIYMKLYMLKRIIIDFLTLN